MNSKNANGKAGAIVLGIVAAILVIAMVSIGVIIYTHRRQDFDSSKYDTTTYSGVVEYHTDAETPYLVKRLPNGDISDNPFKVISVTDLHLSSDKNYGFTLEILSRILERENPDFVVVNGDLAVNAGDTGNVDYSMHKIVAEFFEARNQFWTFTLGNHDGENNCENRYEYLFGEEQSALNDRKAYADFFKAYEHCLIDNDDSAGFGYCNHIINVKGSQGQIIESLIMMDSGISNPPEEWYEKFGVVKTDGRDDFIKSSQIEWYTRRIGELTEENNGVTPKSLVFFHIPLGQAYTAYEEYKYTDNHIFGYRMETPCYSQDTGFFDAVKKAGSTEAIIFGHEHDNDFCVELDGVKLMYSQSLSFLAYNSRKEKVHKDLYKYSFKALDYFCDGCTVYMLKNGGKTDIVPKRNSENREIFNGLEEQAKEIGLAI